MCPFRSRASTGLQDCYLSASRAIITFQVLPNITIVSALLCPQPTPPEHLSSPPIFPWPRPPAPSAARATLGHLVAYLLLVCPGRAHPPLLAAQGTMAAVSAVGSKEESLYLKPPAVLSMVPPLSWMICCSQGVREDKLPLPTSSTNRGCPDHNSSNNPRSPAL